MKTAVIIPNIVVEARRDGYDILLFTMSEEAVSNCKFIDEDGNEKPFRWNKRDLLTAGRKFTASLCPDTECIGEKPSNYRFYHARLPKIRPRWSYMVVVVMWYYRGWICRRHRFVFGCVFGFGCGWDCSWYCSFNLLNFIFRTSLINSCMYGLSSSVTL